MTLGLFVSVSTDGVFGQCNSLPLKDVDTFDISPSVVQRFRILLEKLSNRGNTLGATYLLKNYNNIKNHHICLEIVKPVQSCCKKLPIPS